MRSLFLRGLCTVWSSASRLSRWAIFVSTRLEWPAPTQVTRPVTHAVQKKGGKMINWNLTKFDSNFIFVAHQAQPRQEGKKSKWPQEVLSCTEYFKWTFYEGHKNHPTWISNIVASDFLVICQKVPYIFLCPEYGSGPRRTFSLQKHSEFLVPSRRPRAGWPKRLALVRATPPAEFYCECSLMLNRQYNLSVSGTFLIRLFPSPDIRKFLQTPRDIFFEF